LKRERVAVLAGGGELPVHFLKKAAEKNIEAVVIGIKGEENPAAIKLASRYHKVKFSSITKIIGLLKKEKINKLVFLGYIRHTEVLKPGNLSLDLRAMKVLLRAADLRTAPLMNEIIKELEGEGIRVLPTTYLMEGLLAPAGAAGRVRPKGRALKDAEFSFKMASELARADIGQTVVVKNGVVVAAEAQEGTDECIRRGAKIAGPGFVAAKAARPKQDLRYDVPVIGIKTIKLLKELKAAGVVVQAGKTFLLDREEAVKTADRSRLFILGR